MYILVLTILFSGQLSMLHQWGYAKLRICLSFRKGICRIGWTWGQWESYSLIFSPSSLIHIIIPEWICVKSDQNLTFINMIKSQDWECWIEYAYMYDFEYNTVAVGILDPSIFYFKFWSLTQVLQAHATCAPTSRM